MQEDRNAMSLGQLAAWAWRETPPVQPAVATGRTPLGGSIVR
jgi:hypothetical protein